MGGYQHLRETAGAYAVYSERHVSQGRQARLPAPATYCLIVHGPAKIYKSNAGMHCVSCLPMDQLPSFKKLGTCCAPSMNEPHDRALLTLQGTALQLDSIYRYRSVIKVVRVEADSRRHRHLQRSAQHSCVKSILAAVH
jgi:hypothetical protein